MLGHSIPDKNIPVTLLDPVQQYADILKQHHYKDQPIVDTDWPPRIGKQFFGRLVLIEKQDSSQKNKTAWYQLRGQVDKIVEMSRNKQITVDNILKQPTNSSSSLRVVIDGPPGIGKTTLCRKLLNMWSNGTLVHHQYDLVLYCPLRNSQIATAKALVDLFVIEIFQLSEVVEQINKKEGNGLLIIFDGWDELSEKLRQSSLVASIIRREKLVHCSVVVTSRSYAASSLLAMRNLSRHVQVIGFSEEEISIVIIQTLQKNSRLAQKLIESYVSSSNTERNEDDDRCSNNNSDTDSDDNSDTDSDNNICDQGSNDNINKSTDYDSESSHSNNGSNSSSSSSSSTSETLGSSSIDGSDNNVAIHEPGLQADKDSQLALKLINELKVRNDVQSLCYVPLVCSMVILVYCKEGGHLPTTLTQLYENFILQTIRRYAMKCDVNPHILGNLSILPEQFAKPLHEMCQIAYINLALTKMTFSLAQLDEQSLVIPEAVNANYLGLMTKFTEFDEEKYQFLHLSIQEFLAAWWIAKHEKKTEEIFMHHFDDDHFRMCLRFVAGLTHLEHESYQQYFDKQQFNLLCKDTLVPSLTYQLYWFSQNLNISLDGFHQTFDNSDHVPILLFQLLYESQNTKLCQVLAKSIKNQSLCLHSSLSLFDWLCFSYFLKNSKMIWNHLHLQDVYYHPLSVFCDGLSHNNSLETQCRRLEVWLNKPTDESICKLLQLPLLNNIQECYCTLSIGQYVPCLVLLQFLNLPQLKILHLFLFRHIETDDSALVQTNNACYTESCTELEKCIEMKSTLQEMNIMYEYSQTFITSTITSIIRGITKNATIKSFSLELGTQFFRDHIPDRVIKQLLKNNNKLEALLLNIPDSFISSSLTILEVNTPLTALEIKSSTKLVTSLLPHIKGLHCLILHKPYPPHLLFLSHPSLHTLFLDLDTAERTIELFTILVTNITLKTLGIFITREGILDKDEMDEEQKVKSSSVGTSLIKMLTQNQNLRYFEIAHVNGVISSPSSFLSSLIVGIQHNSSLQQLSISLELPNNEQIRNLLNVISQKNNLIELEIGISLHHSYHNHTSKSNMMTSLFCEQLVPAVTNMLQSHTTIKRLWIHSISHNFDDSSQPNWIELVQNLYNAIFTHPSLEFFDISEDCLILMDTFNDQRKMLIDKHREEQPHKPLPIIKLGTTLQ